MSNSLASVHPELIPEWSERNLPLTPDKITFGSNKRVWWKGACGHEWETSVKARSKGEKCPICSGARVIEGINDLVTLKPLLAQEWSEKNKLKPTEVSVASHKKIIWKCKHGHEWEVRNKYKYDVPLWHRPILSVAEATEYFGIGSNKIYELTEKENCPFVIWIGSRRVIKRTAFERFLEKQYSI